MKTKTAARKPVAALRSEARDAKPARTSAGANKPRKTREARDATPAPRVVYAFPPVALATVLAREDETHFRVRIAGVERLVAADPSVDPALLEEAAATGARVVIDAGTGDQPVIAGVIQTARAVQIDREGSVDVRVKRFAVTAVEEAVVKTYDAFIRLKEAEAEIYASRVMTRARDLVRIFGAMVKLN